LQGTVRHVTNTLVKKYVTKLPHTDSMISVARHLRQRYKKSSWR